MFKWSSPKSGGHGQTEIGVSMVVATISCGHPTKGMVVATISLGPPKKSMVVATISFAPPPRGNGNVDHLLWSSSFLGGPRDHFAAGD